MKYTKHSFHPRFALLKLDLRRFYSIFETLNRRAELERLVGWAKKKRLNGPLLAYRSRLMDEEIRLADYTVRSPRLAYWARLLHELVHPHNKPPKNLRRGSASYYRAKGTRSRQT